MKIKTDYLEESFGYFKGYSKDDLRKIIDLQTDLPTIYVKHTFRYPPCSLQLQHIYSIQTSEARNNFCYFHTFEEHEKFAEKNMSMNIVTKSQLNFNGNIQSISSKMDNAFDSRMKNSIREIQNPSNTLKITTNPKSIFHNQITAPASRLENFNHSSFGNQQATQIDIGFDQKLRDDDTKQRGSCEESNVNNNFDEDNMIYWYNGRCGNHSSHCSRKLVYFISRIGIVVAFDKLSQQQFYEGHHSKISAIVVHPRFVMVATGEKAYLPKIHIWNPETLQNITICDTFHKQGIIVLKFSLLNYFLLSVSVDQATSMQITDWRNGKIIAFRNAFKDKITCAQFDPNDETQFVTLANCQVDCWRITANTIMHEKSVRISLSNTSQFLTDLCFIDYFVNGKADKLILVTTSGGDMGLIVDKQCFESGFQSLQMMISFLKIVILHNTPIIVAAVQDCTLRLYNLNFDELFNVSISKDPTESFDSKIQSLDFFIQRNSLYCLIGLARGLLVEIDIKFNYSEDEGFSFYQAGNSSIIYRGHISRAISDGGPNKKMMIDKQIIFCFHQTMPIMVSVGADKNLLLWNVKERRIVNEVGIEDFATCIKFTPNMKYLVVGFITGKVKFYALSSIPSQDWIFMSEKRKFEPEFEADGATPTTPVINIEFSKDSNMVAVSYTNTDIEKQIEMETVTMDSSLIHILTSKDTSKAEKGTKNNNSYNHHGELKLASKNFLNLGASKTLQGIAEGSRFGTSCYFMMFSDDCNYLVAYYQQIRNDLHSRKVSDTNGRYVVFSIISKSEKSLSSIGRPIKMNTLYFPSHLNGQRILGSIKSSPDYSKENNQARAFQNLNNDRIIVSCTSGLQSVAALGSKTGELYLIKRNMVSMPKEESYSSSNFLYQAKRYSAHTSFINQIEFNKISSLLFTTGIDDECIFQWSVNPIEPKIELDHLDGIELQDRYYIHEVEKLDQLTSFITRTCLSRKRISEVLLQKDNSVFPEFKLQLKNIIGRKAFTRRSNIILISNGYLVYCSGTALVLLENKFNYEKAMGLSEFHKANDQLINDPERPSITHNAASNIPPPRFQQELAESLNIEMIASMNELRPNTLNNQRPIIVRSMGALANKNRLTEAKYGTFNKQSILFPNTNYQIKATSEIMCFEMAQDNKTLCVATRDEYSSILVWEICSQSFRGSFILEQCISPIILRCSDDSKYLVCCGITKDYSMCLYYCSIGSLEILGLLNLKYSIPEKIVDLAFLPFKNDEFMTVGFIHCAKWRYRAGILEFNEVKLQLSEKKSAISDYQHETKQEDAHNLFLVLKFLDPNKFILTDATGFIYLCHNQKIHDKHHCLNDSPVTAIALLNDENGTIVAGGFSLELNFYRVCSKNPKKMHFKHLIKVALSLSISRDLSTEDDNHSNHEAQVQTLIFVNPKMVICGTRDGSIYEVKLESNLAVNDNKCECSDKIKQNTEQSSTRTSQLMLIKTSTSEIIRFFDHHEPKVVDFSDDSKFLFCISKKGYLIVYNMISFSTVFHFDFNDYLQNMYIVNNNIILMFKNRILFLPPDLAGYQSQLKDSSNVANYPARIEVPSSKSTDRFNCMNLQESIDDSCMSRNKRFLALAVSKVNELSFTSRQIFFYKVNPIFDTKNINQQNGENSSEKGSQNKFLQFLHKIDISDSCKLMDFSFDESYHIYVNKFDKKYVHYINETSCSFMGDNFSTKIEWQGLGMMVSDPYKSIESHFTAENKLKSIVRLSERAILTSDDIGTVG